MKAIMFQGTGSDVGKSLLVAGLARAFSNRGLRVRPFKPQNMSNNAAVTSDGGEIGRAQALQARAARVAPTVHMNPVLLKPQSEIGAQVVVQGRVVGNAPAREYRAMKPRLMPSVLESFHTIGREADIVLVEGAGSASEVNLRASDIANMGFAEATGVPVVLIGDIERGGIIASLVGTKSVIDPKDAERIVGFIVNKFRGDPSIFDDGMKLIAAHTGWGPLGLVPYFGRANALPPEDSQSLTVGSRDETSSKPLVVVLAYPRMSNFDDFDPLRLEPGVDLVFLRPGEPIPGSAAAVILPGSKATIADLATLRETGWDIDLAAHVRRGGHVLGVCGGYQMLGKTLADPGGVEGPVGTIAGLAMLDVDTVLAGDKILVEIEGAALEGHPITGYEMHIGRTTGPGTQSPMICFADGRSDGAVHPSGRIRGCYIHGLFSSDRYRAGFLASIGASASSLTFESEIEVTLDALAAHLETHVDCDRILALARTPDVPTGV
jgi:adenosylcobyric acid synthase